MAGGFYDPGPLRHVAINLFYGWGYDFYRRENQLRADDQLVRSRAGSLIALARDTVAAAEADWRRDKLPAPSRAHPFPDPAAVAGAQALERLAAGIGLLVGRLQAQPTPENDRMTQRFRLEGPTLQALIACDEQLVGQADLLRSMLDGREAAWMLEHRPEIKEGVRAIGATLQQRQAVLVAPAM